MQGCDDILLRMFCHNSFGGALSLNIQNAIIVVWLFIIMFTYKNNCCLNSGFFFLRVIWHVDKSSISGRRQFMGVATTINLDPTLTLGIGALGRRGYWLIGAWSKSESPFC
jgi:hypothetical protein